MATNIWLNRSNSTNIHTHTHININKRRPYGFFYLMFAKHVFVFIIIIIIIDDDQFIFYHVPTTEKIHSFIWTTDSNIWSTFVDSCRLFLNVQTNELYAYRIRWLPSNRKKRRRKKPDPYLICIYDDDDVAKQTNQPNQTKRRTIADWLNGTKKNAVKREVVTLQLNIKRIQNWSRHTHTHTIYIKCNLEFFFFFFEHRCP